MEVDATQTQPLKPLTDREREELRKRGACFRCRMVGHRANQCPKRPQTTIAATTEAPQEGSIEEVNTPTSTEKTTTDELKKTGQLREETKTTLIDEKPSDRVQKVSVSSTQNHQESHLLIPVTIGKNGKQIQTYAMIDSEATGNFVNAKFVEKNQLETSLLSVPQVLNVVDGRPISSGMITRNLSLDLTMGGVHLESATMFVTSLGHFPIILGLPWLKLHAPNVEWKTGKIQFDSDFCRNNCISTSVTLEEEEIRVEDHPTKGDKNEKSENLSPKPVRPLGFVNAAAFRILKKTCEIGTIYLKPAPAPRHWTDNLDKPANISATSSISADIAAKERPKEDPAEHPDYPRNLIPEEYLDFQDVFSKTASDRLPGIRGGKLDHRMPLEPGTQPPFLPLRNMSELELDTTRKYLEENIPKGWVRASTSPAGAPILFAKKKDGC